MVKFHPLCRPFESTLTFILATFIFLTQNWLNVHRHCLKWTILHYEATFCCIYFTGSKVFCGINWKMHDLTYATAKVKCFPTWKKADSLKWGFKGESVCRLKAVSSKCASIQDGVKGCEDLCHRLETAWNKLVLLWEKKNSVSTTWI